MLAVHNTAMGLAIAVCFGGAFSLVANGTMAFALSMVPATKAGLGTGISFSHRLVKLPGFPLRPFFVEDGGIRELGGVTAGLKLLA